MGYIKNLNHFKNFLNKICADNNINPKEKCFPLDIYKKFIYDKNLQDNFTWDLKNNPELIYKENFLSWINNIKNNKYFVESEYNFKISKNFSDLLNSEKLSNKSGVYSFWDVNNIPMYIGVSINLQERIFTSYKEKFSKYNSKIYLKYIITKSKADSHILEVFLIEKYKPILNVTSKSEDNLTIEVKNIPNFSKKILCNLI